ncbi:MAG: AAA family ATPase [Candidatus Thermoplasmatota archaeon]
MASADKGGRSATVNERILVHLHEMGAWTRKGEYPISLTQEGIAEGIGIRPNHIPRAVKRLRDDGLIEELTSHVIGMGRRRKVYLLTQRGHTISEELRRRLSQLEMPVILLDGTVGTLIPMEISKQLSERPSLSRILSAQDDAGTVHLARIVKSPSLDAGRVDFSTLFRPPEQVFGRTGEMVHLMRLMESEQGKVIVISGVKGVGKSTLAYMMAQKLKGGRDIFWHTCHSWDPPDAIYRSLAEFLTMKGKNALKSHLSKKGIAAGRVLQLILDDMADLDVLVIVDNLFEMEETAFNQCTRLAEDLAQLKDITVLVTTRDSRMVERLRGTGVVLEGLDRESAKALVAQHGPEMEEFDKLYAMTSGHPLALELIASGAAVDQGSEEGLTKEERVMMRCLRAFDVIFG